MTLLASLRDWLKAQQLDAVLLSSRQNILINTTTAKEVSDYLLAINSRIWGSPPDQVMW